MALYDDHPTTVLLLSYAKIVQNLSLGEKKAADIFIDRVTKKGGSLSFDFFGYLVGFIHHIYICVCVSYMCVHI